VGAAIVGESRPPAEGVHVEFAAGMFPGKVRQFGFVIPDIQAAINQWAALGVAPWLIIPEFTLSGSRYRGELSEPVVSIALANTGDMQIELIQQHCDTPSAYREFMDATGGGLNQVAYWVEDIEGTRAAALDAGWTEVWFGDAGVKYYYLEHPDSPVALVELMELNEMSRGMGAMTQEAAEAWKPGQPILMG
jgi:hypothetical protein